MAKNNKIPPIQGSGRLLWPFYQIQNQNLSLLQIFDQMIRHYHRHAVDSDIEGDRYKTKLLEEAEKKFFQDPTISSDTQENLNLLIEDYSSNIKKRSNSGNELADSLKNQLLPLLVEMQISIEYASIQKELDESQEEISSIVSLVSIASSIDEESKGSETSNSHPKREVRSSSRLKSGQPRKLKVQLQEEKSLLQEISKLESEAADYKQQLSYIQEERNSCKILLQQKDDELSSVKGIITSLKEENATLQQELHQLQSSFESLNIELAAIRNNIDTSSLLPLTMENHLTSSSPANLSGSSDQSKEEDSTLPPSTPLDHKKVKEIFKQLSSIETLEKINESDVGKYKLGLKLLKEEFIRHGRKVWNDKTVESLLKCLTKECTLSLSSIRLNFHSSSNKLLQLLKHLSGIKLALSKCQMDSTKEFEILKSSKAKYLNLQQIINTNFDELQKNLDEIYNLSLDLLDGIHEDNLPKENRLEDLIPKVMESTLKNLSTVTIPAKSLNTPTSTKKLVIIPRNESSVDEVTKCLRSKARETEDFPEISSIKRTRNKNLEIKSLPENLEKLTEIIHSSELNDKVQLVDPDTRQSKILLIRLPKDITQEEIHKDLTSNSHFKMPFTILKNIEAKNKLYNNWVIQGSIKECNKILKQKRIKILTESYRVVHFLKISRCTKCQALDHHTKSNCRWSPECGHCAGNHLSSDCTKDTIACINCIRGKKKDFAHKVWDPSCPTFQQARKEKLQYYYNPPSSSSTGNPEPTNYISSSSPYLNSKTTYRNETSSSSRSNDIEEIRTVRFKSTTSRNSEDDSQNIRSKDRIYINNRYKGKQHQSSKGVQPPHYR